jgi:hypothetical protein
VGSAPGTQMSGLKLVIQEEDSTSLQNLATSFDQEDEK